MRVEIIFNEATRDAAVHSMTVRELGPCPEKVYTEDYKDYTPEGAVWMERRNAIYNDFLGPVFEDAEDANLDDGFLTVVLKDGTEYYYNTSTINRIKTTD